MLFTSFLLCFLHLLFCLLCKHNKVQVHPCLCFYRDKQEEALRLLLFASLTYYASNDLWIPKVKDAQQKARKQKRMCFVLLFWIASNDLLAPCAQKMHNISKQKRKSTEDATQRESTTTTFFTGKVLSL